MSSPTLKAITVHQQRVALAKQGYALVKVRTATKEAFEPRWQHASYGRNVQQWEQDQTTDDALNTGLLTSGMRAIDVDIDDPVLAQYVVDQCRAILGHAPKRFREGSGSCMLFYRSTKSSPKPVTLMGTLGKVEARGNAQQAVIYGIHEGTGTLYQWDTDLLKIPRNSLREVSDEQVQELFNAIYQQIGAVSPASKLSGVGTPVAVMPEPAASPTLTKRDTANARAVLTNECKSLAAMQPGSHRNSALNEASFTVGTVIAWLDPHEAAQALYQASVDNGYVAKRGAEAAQQTIMSGLNAGALKPRAPLPEDDSSDRIDLSNFRIGGKHIDEVLAELGVGKARPQSTRKASPVAKPDGKRTVVLTGLSAVQETAIEWHWPGYLPAGMLTLLSGAGGTGKSTLAFGFAATITTGGVWPDGERCASCGNVLIWSSEDDVARTIKPRLMAAGADINRIAVVESTSDSAGMRLPFDPSTDIDSLRAEVRRIGGVALLIIDPIVSAVSGDMHKANDVRRSLQPIVDFAAEFNCAVLGITHFAKNTGGKNASERVIGSQAFAALARMVLVTAKEDDSDQRVFTRAKSNISADDGGLHYTIEAGTINGGNGLPIQTTRVVWGTAVQGSAKSILNEVEGEEAERKPLNRVEEAEHFLRAELANGPVPARDLIERAKRDLAMNERSLQRARERLGIVATKAGYQGAWVWSYRLAMPSPLPAV
jgi:putative DNA primase/helicase